MLFEKEILSRTDDPPEKPSTPQPVVFPDDDTNDSSTRTGVPDIVQKPFEPTPLPAPSKPGV